MARLAGRKKDGAWVRTNKALKKLATNDAAAFATLTGQVVADNFVTAMAQAYIDILAFVGVDSGLDATTLITGWIEKGIPREVWFGYSRFDQQMTVQSEMNNDYSVGQHATIIRNGASALRAIITQFIQGMRMMHDLQNVKTAAQGNPGGIADGNKLTK